MSEVNADLDLDTGHVLFIAIVGYSRLPVTEQYEALHQLSQAVRNTDAFRAAETADNLLWLSTGTGIALVFADNPDAPARCAIQLSKALQSSRDLKVRMGIHSGAVQRLTDASDKSSVTGPAVSIAHLVMDCGDSGHILLSKRVAESLSQHWPWQSSLHDLGEYEMHYGEPISIVNLYSDEVGNPTCPEKFKQRRKAERLNRNGSVRLSPVPAQNTLLALIFFTAIGVAICYWIFSPPSASSSPKSAGRDVQVVTHPNAHATPAYRTAAQQ